MGIPKVKREVMGYSVNYCRNGFCVKLKGNPNTKRYQKILNEWGESVRDALLEAFDDKVTYNSLDEFLIKEN